MRELFLSINSFLKIKEHCVFCKTPLKCRLTNFVITQSIPILAVAPVDGKFKFDLNYTSGSFELKSSPSINMETNDIDFNITVRNDLIENWESTYHQHAIDIFEDMKPHIELYCPSKTCKMKYALQSDWFRCNRHMNDASYYIRSFRLYIESFVVDNLLIHNDWLDQETLIYSKNNTRIDPIKTDILDLESMSKEKVITRIKTLVTFS